MSTIKQVYVERHIENPASLTKEEFIKMVMEDIEATKAPYKKYTDLQGEERYAKDLEWFEENLSKTITKIIEQSKKKYKREKNQIQWAETEIAKLPKEFKREKSYYFGDDLSWVNFDIEPWRNGTDGFTINEYLENQIGCFYDKAIKNKYFLGCTGWSIVQATFTEIHLHLPEELKAEWEADQEKLVREITEFYATCRYCGD